MTTAPVHAELTLSFPTPGPLLGTANRDLYLAAEGSDNQKAAIGDSNLLPKPWDPPTIRNPQLRAELWTWLEEVVEWINHEYTWDPDGMIPPCWPQHPHLVHELAVLADQRRRAGIALDSSGLEDGTATPCPDSSTACTPASKPTATKNTNPGQPAADTPATPTSGTPSNGDVSSKRTFGDWVHQSPFLPAGQDSPSSTPRPARSSTAERAPTRPREGPAY